MSSLDYNKWKKQEKISKSAKIYPYLVSDETVNNALRKKLNEQDKVKQTFHKNIRLCLFIGQCFALIPVKGVLSNSATSLKFKWLDFRTIHSIIVISAGFAFAIINVDWLIKTKVRFNNIGPVLWFTSNSITMCEFIRVARQWPVMMKNWETIEIINHNNYSKCGKKTRRYILFASCFIPMCLLIDHVMSIVKDYKMATACTKKDDDIVEAYFRQAFPAFYGVFSYSVFSGCLLQLLNFYCTFTWTYCDNIIIVLSLGLQGMFGQFNEHFASYQGRIITNDTCGNLRLRYNQLLNLVYHVDRILSTTILMSFSNNLYYICVQLFHSVNPTKTLLRTVYFWYSLIFLIGRTVFVSLCASKIYDESRKPLIVLRTIPALYYKNEAKRFMEQLINSKAALSGMNFFYITRKFMLSVAGTIVTYELVLIQLHFTFEEEEERELCG